VETGLWDGGAAVVSVIQLRPALYEAKAFSAQTEYGEFKASGTLCGNIDFVGPFKNTFTISPDEALSVIIMLQNARADVLDNSRPYSDPRIIS
jgi:hypothetical protein